MSYTYVKLTLSKKVPLKKIAPLVCSHSYNSFKFIYHIFVNLQNQICKIRFKVEKTIISKFS